jgi:hypothetical protein
LGSPTGSRHCWRLIRAGKRGQGAAAFLAFTATGCNLQNLSGGDVEVHRTTIRNLNSSTWLDGNDNFRPRRRSLRLNGFGPNSVEAEPRNLSHVQNPEDDPLRENLPPAPVVRRHAVEAASFYVSLFPDSRVDRVTPIPADTPSGPAGSVPVVEFTLARQPFMAISAGPLDSFNHAISFMVNCDDQAEIDRLMA